MQSCTWPAPALCALRNTLTHSGHNIQLSNIDLWEIPEDRVQNFRGLVNCGINGTQPALPSQPESPCTHLYIPGVSPLVTSLRNTTGGQRKWCQGESQVWQSKELQPPSRPPHQSQVEMPEIAKIEAFISRILFKDKLYWFVRIKLFSLKTTC